MESNWRWAVWEIGWAYSEMRLAARLLDAVEEDFLTVGTAGSNTPVIVRLLPDTAGFQPVVVGLPQPPDFRFPWDYHVVPD